MEREKNNFVQQLREQGKTVYSISRINSFNSCQYGYHLTYNKRQRGSDNVYSTYGSCLHDSLEMIYNNKATREDMSKSYLDTNFRVDILGQKFPSETIEKSWRADIEHFIDRFEKIDKRVLTEKEVVFEIADGIWLMGYIDAIFPSENQKLEIIDWKTSSEFRGDKFKEAGRQLIVYKMALEQLSSLKVDKVGWFMIKYVYVNYNGRKKMCNRGKWVKQISNLLKTDLKKIGYEDFVKDMYIETAINNNNLDNMPETIKNKYVLEDCIVYYDLKQDDIKECIEYIKNAVETIENKDKENEEEWKSVEINAKSEFFCKNLCNHKSTCKFLKEYLDTKEE